LAWADSLVIWYTSPISWCIILSPVI
jgi:hypothetical protein